MSKDLRLQVILSAVDKFTKPLRGIQTSNKKLAETLRRSRQELKELNLQAKQIEGFKRTKQSLDTANKAYQQASAKVTKLAQELSLAQNPTKSQIRAFEQAKSAAAKLKVEVGTLSASLQRQRESLKNSGISTRQLSQAQIRLNSDIDSANLRLQQQEQQLKRVANQEKRMSAVRNSYQQTMDVHNKMAGTGAGMATVGVGILYGAKRTLTAGFDFEKGMSTVQALTRLSNDSSELKALTEQARHLGATTSFTANDVAGGMGFLAMAGYTPDKIQKAIPSMLDLAKAAGMDDSLADVADIASNIQSAYKIPADEMKRVADVLAFGFTTSNTDLRMLGETMKYLAPNAQAAGQEFESMVATVGLLGNVGIQSSTAGTALRMSLVRLASPPKAANKALKELGVTIADSSGRMKAMPIILSEVNAAFKKKGISGIGNVKKMAYVSDIFGVEASAAMLELLDKQSEIDPEKRIDAYIEQIKNQKDTASQIASTKANNLDGDVKNMISASEDVAITIYNDIRNPLRDITNEVTEIIRKFGFWAKQNPKIVKWIMAIALGFAAVMSVLGGISLMIAAMIAPLAMAKLSLAVLGIKGSGFLSLLINPIKLIGSAFMMLGKALLANPIILIITTIAGLAYLIYKNWDAIAPFLKNVWEKVSKIFDEALSAIKTFISDKWDQIVSDVKALPERFKQIGGEIIDSLKNGILEKWEALKSTFADIKRAATDLLPEWMLSDDAKAERLAAKPSGASIAGKTLAGLFDRGGYIPRGQFGIVGEYGPEIVNGPANVTSRKHTAALAAAALTLGAMPSTANQPIHPYALPPKNYVSTSVNITQRHSEASRSPIEIHIHAAPSQSAADIAKEVAKQLAYAQRRAESRRLSQYQDSEEF
ncbi:tail tape measure protein, TIGR01760 family [Providencia alcalifaciens F90-2004]|uniref:phage tail tape measure protein n=1 Tax=Providencia alcalifaciens TaxID=126385 RepID=UPI000451502E|nr:phage tail tape measure protein [Providencia alcalifaciens]ETT04472.1 tail tape measure protein, TIGR01760 family [Providencia alcalifaciens F90-2004]